jgi:hypothetical protein
MPSFFRRNSLSIVTGTLFLSCWIAQIGFGFHQHNDDLNQHGKESLTLREYLTSGPFIEATAENWESEFLEMASYVLLTARLFQRGSAESKKPGGREAVDADPREARNDPDAPWPVRRGGWVLKLYENSLSAAFLCLFLIAFTLHAIGGARAYNVEQIAHGRPTVTAAQFLGTSQFWFQSFQNWQSEYLALTSMIVLSIFLRQRGSPQSKPVAAPHSQTGPE